MITGEWIYRQITRANGEVAYVRHEEVVRCKDCQHSTVVKNESSGVMARYCEAFTFARMMADDDYCSYGSQEVKCCLTCKWIDTDPYDHGLVCVNADSPYCAELWARPDDVCDFWERKDNE